MRPGIRVLVWAMLGVLTTGGPRAAPTSADVGAGLGPPEGNDGRSRGALRPADPAGVKPAGYDNRFLAPELTARAQTPAPGPLALDVWVRDLQGQPARGLSPRDFIVQIDGRERRVLSAQFIDYAAAPSTSPAGAAPAAPLPGRAIAVVVDDLSLEGRDAAPLGDAAARWIARLHPSDRVAVVRATAGNARVTAANTASDAATLVQSAVAAARREPGGAARDAEFRLERRTLEQAEALASAVSWLAAQPGPRVLVVLSMGLVMSPPAARYLSATYQIARDGGLSSYLISPATAGAASSGWNSVPATGTTAPGASLDQIAAGMLARSLRAQTRADDVFDEVERAVSGVYRLEVEAPAAGPLPRSLPATISLRPVALAVRAARLVAPPAGTAPPRTTEERTRDILAGVDVAADIDIDATTTLSRDSASDDHFQLTVSVVLRQDLPSPVRVAFGLLDETGTVRFSTVDVPDAVDDARRTSVSIPVAPGWHRLTLVAQDGNERLGSLSRAVHARLRTIGAYAVAEPRVMWRTGADAWQVLGDDVLPEGAVVAASVFDLYPDAPGREPPPMPLRLEDDAGREVAVQTITPARTDQGWRLSGEVRLDGLAPGEYVFRLDTTALEDGSGSLAVRVRKTTAATATRPAPPPLPAAADVLNLFRAGVRDNWPRSAREDLLVPELLTPQLKALAGSRPLPAALLNGTGDAWWTALRALAKQTGAAGLAARGLTALHDEDASAAESHLRDAVAASPTSNAARRLLGVAFAASGRDDAATGVWSLAAGERTADPRWTLAFAEALGRVGDYRAALDMLRQMPGEPADRRLHRLVEALMVVGLMDEAERALVAWEAGDGRDQPAGRLTFYLVALRFIAALQPSADAQALDAFRRAADRYVAAGGEYANIVTPWLQSAVALER